MKGGGREREREEGDETYQFLPTKNLFSLRSECHRRNTDFPAFVTAIDAGVQRATEDLVSETYAYHTDTVLC